MVLITARPGAAQTWQPPLGIPAPSFGITEVAPPLPSPWASDVGGFYYVQEGGGNPGNGFPGNPRGTIPASVPAGAVVVIAGTYNVNHEKNFITLNGVPGAPIFLRGLSNEQRPTITQKWIVQGAYYVLEYLNFQWSNSSGNGKLEFLGHHAVLRHSDLRGDTATGVGAVFPQGSQLVIWNNFLHDMGDVHASFDQDNHCIAVGPGTDNLWIVDNEIARCSGDGIQLNAGDPSVQATLHHVYIGRNNSHSHKQSGMWTKQAVDVIFSQNSIHSMRPSNSSSGQCTGGQYGPEYVWFLFNVMQDCDSGVRIESTSDLGTGTKVFVIGNVIHNIHSQFPDLDNPHASAAIVFRGLTEHYVVNNTIWNYDAGIMSPATGFVHIENNILGGRTQPLGRDVFLEDGGLAAASNFNNNLLSGSTRIQWGSSAVQSLEQFQSSTGKGQGSFVADPRFVDPVVGNFDIQPSSPAIDAGISHAVYAIFQARYGINLGWDAASRPRPQSRAFDIGAFEFGSSRVEPVTGLALSADRSAPQQPGTTITFTTSVTGGVAPYQFKWWVWNGTGWFAQTGWVESTAFAWTPTAANPAYMVLAWVRSAGSFGDTPDTTALVTFPIQVAPVTGLSLTADRAAPQRPGTTILFTPAASGGVPPYQFKWWVWNGVGWFPLTTWVGSTAFAWTPTVPNPNYMILVWVRSAGNLVDAPDRTALTTFPIQIPPVTGLNLNADRAAPQPPGTTILFTPAASGGVTPYQFKWWVWNEVGWFPLTTWVGSTAFAWTPTVPNPNYMILVWVRSAGNLVDAPDQTALTNFPIQGGTGLSLTGTRPPPQ
jgi:hypothetical protein